MSEPASIRTKNPGAMWGRLGPRPSAESTVETNNPLAKKWGSVQTVYLSDGLGQGNNIAVFPTYMQGICAQLDLWRTSDKYRNKRFADAINTWDGHNNTPSYIAYVKQRVPGMTENTIMNDEFWRGPMGIAFLKAQAGHEAGKPYPATDADWAEAQKLVFSGAVVAAKPTSKATKAAGGVVVAGTVAVGVHQGWGPAQWIMVALILAGLATAFYFIRKNIDS